MTEFAFPATVTEGRGLATVTAFNVNAAEPVFVANQNHPHWDGILDGLRRGDPSVWGLFDVATGVMARLTQISERYSYNGSDVLFDGDPVSGPFADLLARSLEEGNAENYTALAKFGEKLAANPSKNSREQSYRFLANHRFQITADGDVVAYKSVTPQPDGSFLSGFASRAKGKPSGFVNGSPVPELSCIPQRVGDVVTMPRSEVVENPLLSCERGLHVGTVNYFGGFGAHTLEVHVNPRDFVSIPEGEDAKARVCRYYVARVASAAPENDTVISDAPAYQWAGDVSYRV